MPEDPALHEQRQELRVHKQSSPPSRVGTLWSMHEIAWLVIEVAIATAAIDRAKTEVYAAALTPVLARRTLSRVV